jgi:hypothetical protein
MNKNILLVLLLGSVLTGCAFNRAEIKLALPTATETTQGRVVVIRSVKDERVFEQAPKEPNIPSVGFGKLSVTSRSELLRTVGRKRNGFGEALANVQLIGEQTVETVVRENLAAALRQAGYQVKEVGSVADAPLIIDVHINKFWIWIDHGFMKHSVKAEVSTSLDISGVALPMSIESNAQELNPPIIDKTWASTFEKAFSGYRTNASAKFGELNLSKK